MLNVLYIGPNDSEWAQMNRPVSLAAAKWSRGFLSALSKYCKLTVLTHTYEVAWPKGKVFWRSFDERLYPKEWECTAIRYPALKYIRDLWWMIFYPIMAMKIIRKREIDAVLFYNCCEPWQRWTMRVIKRYYKNVPIFPIVLDGRDPIQDKWRRLGIAARYADGFIPLSWWMYENMPKQFPDKKYYHFDGGADAWFGTEPDACTMSRDGRRVVLAHTGELDKWRGLKMMIELVRIMTTIRKDVRFVFCGKSSEKVLRDVFANNSSVELPGFVTEQKMREICNDADVLLNVRDPFNADNILNYPSKLPHYLSFGRPVVSTRLKSMSPDYAGVVVYPKDDTVEAFVQTLNDVLTWSTEQRTAWYRQEKEWFEKNKTWDVMVKKLVKWLEGVVK